MFSLAGRASAAALLVAAGAGLGALLRQPTSPAGAANRPGTSSSQSPAPSTSTHASSPQPPAPSPSGFHGRGPTIAMFQNHGDGNTNFVVHGYDWPPDGLVTLTVVGDGPAAKKIIIDRAGTFNYVIGHDPVFFRRGIPLGWHRVVATVPGIKTAYTRFHVIQGPPPGPPGGPPGPG